LNSFKRNPEKGGFVGRKSQYDEKVKPYLEKIKEMVAVATEKYIAEKILHITQATFIKYKKEHEELAEAVRIGIPETVVKLKLAIVQRALGYCDPITGKHYPPDPQAANLMLKNLDKEWKNDDSTTIELKKEKLKIEKDKGIIW